MFRSLIYNYFLVHLISFRRYGTFFKIALTTSQIADSIRKAKPNLSMVLDSLIRFHTILNL